MAQQRLLGDTGLLCHRIQRRLPPAAFVESLSWSAHRTGDSFGFIGCDTQVRNDLLMPQSRSRGVGTALLERLLLAARNRRIKRLHMICLAENRRVRRLALKFDAELSFQYGSVVGEMKTSRPTPWRKAIPQARSAFRSMVESAH